MNLPEAFFARIEVDDNGCWAWQGSITHKGYAGFSFCGKNHRAHRFAYERLVGPIPDGLVVDHCCEVRSCVNPDHLEVVTNQTNVLRGVGPTARHARQTHCKRGHEFTPENIYVQPSRPKIRCCWTCKKEKDRRRG